MKKTKKNIVLKRVALVLSLCAILLWAILGTGTSLAWFTDTSEDVENIFHFAEFDLDVSHRLDDGTWESIDAKTDIFDNQAVYEPGYTQVVYLKVQNKGTVPFDFKLAVSVTDYTIGTNVFGQTFNLSDYLKFGLVTAKTEAEMNAAVKNRDLAKAIATSELCDYSTKATSLEAKDEIYIALVVAMPEEVANVANYRGDDVPRVDLGLIVKADQQGQ